MWYPQGHSSSSPRRAPQHSRSPHFLLYQATGNLPYPPFSHPPSTHHPFSSVRMPNSLVNPTAPHGRGFASLDIFNPAKLRTEDDINRAAKTLEDSLGDESIGTILRLSLQPSHHTVFELILSSIPTPFLPAPVPNLRPPQLSATAMRLISQSSFSITFLPI